MNITDRLQEKDPTLKIHNEGAWDKPHDPKKAGAYSSFNDAGVEIEVGEFLYAFVRVLKPYRVLETGTHWGIAAAYMTQAIKDNNNKGYLDTLEYLPEIRLRAIKRFLKLGLNDLITCHLIDARAYKPEINFDLILLDTEPQTRFEELIKFFEHLNPGGFVFIHDLHRNMHQVNNLEHGFAWPFGTIPARIKMWVRQDKLRPFHFSTPRGLTGFYKPGKEDYKWE